MESNKRSAEDWPASITKRPATSEQVNLLIPETPNNFMLNYLRESTEDIIEYVTKEAEKIKEFNALSKERKDEILSSISKVIHRRCHDIMLNKVVPSRYDTTLLYYKTYPKEKGLDEEILGMLDTPINPSTIYSHRIDESIEKYFRKIITDLKSYKDENILHDELPSVEAVEDKIDIEDKNLDGNVDVEKKEREKRKDIEEANNKVLDVNEQGRKKLDKYYKMIDKLIAPKIVDLLKCHRSEFQEILKNNKEYLEEEATIKLQLREEIEKSLKEENKQEIENYLSNKNYNYEERDSENYDEDDEVKSETDSMNREMCLDNDEVDRDIISENDSVDSEMNSENVNINEEENAENDNMNEENSENDNINEDNSENNNMNEENSVIDNSQTERDRDKLVQSNENVNRPDPEYRVKLISMPDMPTKELMLEFLNPFNTKTIKKHKTIKNLLIISLNTEEDYNNILKASGTKIGSQKLLISSEINSYVNKNSVNLTQTVDRSDERSEVETAKEPNDKTNAGGEKNNDIRKEVQDPTNEREKNNEIEVLKEKVIVKQEPNNFTNDIITKVKKEIDSGEEILERQVNVNTSHEVNTDASEFVAWVNASPFFPKEIAAFIKVYNPTAIKKHKKVPNVVLVTFKNKADYENFLTMDGHQITNDCTEIKVTVLALEDLNLDYKDITDTKEDQSEEINYLTDKDIKKETDLTVTNPPAATKRKRKQLSGAAKRRIEWWMARGKSLEEAKELCKKPLKEYPEYTNKTQTTSPPEDSTEIQNVSEAVKSINTIEDDCSEAADLESLEDISEVSASTSNIGCDRTSTRNTRFLSGAAKRRIGWWMARGKSFVEAKELSKKPLMEYQEYIDEKSKAATSTTVYKLNVGHIAQPTNNQDQRSIIIGQNSIPTIEVHPTPTIAHGSRLTIDQVAKPASEQVIKLTAGQIAWTANGQVPKPNVGQVESTGNPTTSTTGQVTQPTNEKTMRLTTDLVSKPTGQMMRLTNGQVTKSKAKKRKVFKGALNIGILDALGPMTQEKAEALKTCILRLIDVTPPGEGPKFLQCSRRSGGIMLTCAEEEITRKWLERAVAQIQPWDGADLRIVEASEMNLRYATALVRDEIITEEKILSLLRKQNAGLQIPTWRIVNRRAHELGYIYTFAFDESVVKVLAERGFKLYLGFHQISLRLMGPKPALSL